jgi:rod shape determining protein RodA
MRPILIPLAILCGMSLLVISSYSHHLLWLQSAWIGIGILFIFLSFFLNWRAILNYRWFIWGFYAVSVALLIFTYLTAPVIRNTRSWLVVGPFQFQPVELVKIALILVYASYFSRLHVSVARLKYILTSFVLFFIPAALTLLQPDLGSATILFGIWIGFLLISGLPKERIIAGFLLLAVIGTFGWFFLLKGYQKARIVGVFNPNKDVLGINYQQAQSKIAIGSGGFFGKGYGQGTQVQLGFLSEPATDFIFAALVEEWGVLAGIGAIISFLFMLYQILNVGLARENFEKFLCAGTTIVFGLQFLINVGTALAIVPVIGLPFPFLSYGGSGILTGFFLLSIITSVAYRP